MERAWLLEELKPWEVARKVLGLILTKPLSNPLKWYDSLYREKMLRILERALERKEDYVDKVETYLLEGSKLEYMLPAKPEAKDLLAALEDLDNWPRSPSRAMNDYLQKMVSLQAVKESLGLANFEEENKYPVSEEEFLKELKELSLEEFLELAPKP